MSISVLHRCVVAVLSVCLSDLSALVYDIETSHHISWIIFPSILDFSYQICWWNWCEHPWSGTWTIGGELNIYNVSPACCHISQILLLYVINTKPYVISWILLLWTSLNDWSLSYWKHPRQICDIWHSPCCVMVDNFWWCFYHKTFSNDS